MDPGPQRHQRRHLGELLEPEARPSCRAKGSRELDGAILMMPLVRFIGAKDPAWMATLDAIGEQLTDDGRVRRYAGEDGLTGREGSFAACSFWYVECLARAGRLNQARAISRSCCAMSPPAPLCRGVRRACPADRQLPRPSHIWP
ncbi:glycoside hydrolase family 15 protein [Caulobacter segnis]